MKIKEGFCQGKLIDIILIPISRQQMYSPCVIQGSLVKQHEKAIDQYLVNRSAFNVGDGRVVRWCWVHFQCRVVLLIWLIGGQGPTVLAVGADGGCLDIFFSQLSFLVSFSRF